jgi:hypothetical protein
MEHPTRKAWADELTGKLLTTEQSVAKIRTAMKRSLSISRLQQLVAELRTVMTHKDALESQIARLRFPTPLFCKL